MFRLAVIIAVSWYALYILSEKAIVWIIGPIDLDLWTRVAAAVRDFTNY
jgi:hypothetical protein